MLFENCYNHEYFYIFMRLIFLKGILVMAKFSIKCVILHFGTIGFEKYFEQYDWRYRTEV